MGFFSDLMTNRTERIKARNDRKTTVKTAKISEKTNWVGARNMTKQTAYNNGMDPNAFISNLGDNVQGIFGQNPQGLTGDFTDSLFGNGNSGDSTSTGGTPSMTTLAIAGLAAYFLLKKK
jgi:hypothetical protein